MLRLSRTAAAASSVRPVSPSTRAARATKGTTFSLPAMIPSNGWRANRSTSAATAASGSPSTSSGRSSTTPGALRARSGSSSPRGARIRSTPARSAPSNTQGRAENWPTRTSFGRCRIGISVRECGMCRCPVTGRPPQPLDGPGRGPRPGGRAEHDQPFPALLADPCKRFDARHSPFTLTHHPPAAPRRDVAGPPRNRQSRMHSKAVQFNLKVPARRTWTSPPRSTPRPGVKQLPNEWCAS